MWAYNQTGWHREATVDAAEHGPALRLLGGSWRNLGAGSDPEKVEGAFTAQQVEPQPAPAPEPEPEPEPVATPGERARSPYLRKGGGARSPASTPRSKSKGKSKGKGTKPAGSPGSARQRKARTPSRAVTSPPERVARTRSGRGKADRDAREVRAIDKKIQELQKQGLDKGDLL
eukprot:COSAG04_NODE_4108_length_2294_cov_18.944419_2_plen_174_part_00